MLGFALLLLFQSAPGTWSGALVDAKCYAAQERNVNPTSTLMAVNVDRDAEIRYCRPGPKTKFFTIVDHDGISFTLDSAGNTKAAALVPATPKHSRIMVTVTGEQAGKSIRVGSLALAR